MPSGISQTLDRASVSFLHGWPRMSALYGYAIAPTPMGDIERTSDRHHRRRETLSIEVGTGIEEDPIARSHPPQ